MKIFSQSIRWSVGIVAVATMSSAMAVVTPELLSDEVITSLNKLGSQTVSITGEIESLGKDLSNQLSVFKEACGAKKADCPEDVKQMKETISKMEMVLRDNLPALRESISEPYQEMAGQINREIGQNLTPVDLHDLYYKKYFDEDSGTPNNDLGVIEKDYGDDESGLFGMVTDLVNLVVDDLDSIVADEYASMASAFRMYGKMERTIKELDVLDRALKSRLRKAIDLVGQGVSRQTVKTTKEARKLLNGDKKKSQARRPKAKKLNTPKPTGYKIPARFKR